MAYLVLARKYRPQTFDDVIGQAHVTQTLTNAISAERVAHAILFSGPRGTGKTTIARILAKAMNCETGPTATPCNTCRFCREITRGHASDVYEIDGASNNGVDHIRDLRENVRYMPANARFKIYIIDEVHMLSTPAFNALLKTLEEPPEHVLFFFATTESHKIPITILSRCQQHDLRRIDLQAVVAHMAHICQQEGIEIQMESLNLIARETGGSMRDALSLLDQILACSRGGITHDQVLQILGVVDRQVLYDISAAVLGADLPAILEIIGRVYAYGYDFQEFYADLLTHFRNLLMARIANPPGRLLDLPEAEMALIMEQAAGASLLHLNQIVDALLQEEQTIRFAAQPRIALEITFIRMLQTDPALPIEALIAKLEEVGQKGVFSRTEPPALRKGPAPAEPVSAPLPSGQGPAQPIENRVVARTEGSSTASVAPSSTPARPAGPDASRLVQAPEQAAPPPPGTAQGPVAPPPLPSLDWESLKRIVADQIPAVAPLFDQCRPAEISENKIVLAPPQDGFSVSRIRKKLPQLTECLSAYAERSLSLELTEQQPPPEQESGEAVQAPTQQRQDALNHPLVQDAIEIFNGEILDFKLSP